MMDMMNFNPTDNSKKQNIHHYYKLQATPMLFMFGSFGLFGSRDLCQKDS